MNKVIMMGRLTNDPEIRYSQGENSTAVARFSIAVDRRYRREGEPDADFFNCTAFGKIGEFVEKYLSKGTKVVLTGRLQNNNYTNRDGQQVYSVRIMVEEMEFAESKSASNGQNQGGYDGGFTAPKQGYQSSQPQGQQGQNRGAGQNQTGGGNNQYSQTGNGYGYGGNSATGSNGGNNGNAGTKSFNDGFMNIPDGIDEELPFN